MGGKATESKMAFCELLSYFSQQMAMKGTSAGTSADLLLMVCVCVCVGLHVCALLCVCIYVILQRSLHSSRPQEGEGRWRRRGGRQNIRESGGERLSQTVTDKERQ